MATVLARATQLPPPETTPVLGKRAAEALAAAPSLAPNERCSFDRTPWCQVFAAASQNTLNCDSFLRFFYHLAKSSVAKLMGGKAASALDVAIIRKSVRKPHPFTEDPWPGLPFEKALRELPQLLRRMSSLPLGLQGTPKDILTCRILDFRFQVLKRAGVNCDYPSGVQNFAFLAASILGRTKREHQTTMFEAFVNVDPDSAFHHLRAEWNLNAKGHFSDMWHKCPASTPARLRQCLPAVFHWDVVARDAAARGDLQRLKSIFHIGYRLTTLTAPIVSHILVDLLQSCGSKCPDAPLARRDAIAASILDLLCDDLSENQQRHVLLDNIDRAERVWGSAYPLAAMAALKARLASLPLPRMSPQTQVERQIQLFGGSVKGECPICMENVDQTNYFLYPCRCKVVFHSTCMARAVGQQKIMTCPTCRKQLPSDVSSRACLYN